MSQEKNELFPIEKLPPELVTLIAHHSEKPQVAKNAFAYLPMFRSEDNRTQRILARLAEYAAQANIERIVDLLKIRHDLRLQVLFTLAGLGAQDEMEAILKAHPEDLEDLLSAYCPLRDISGAEFEHITLFQHAVWAKDVRYMAPMMLNCLPQNEKGEKIRIKLLHQYNELMDKGVLYYLHGVKHGEKEKEVHFNLKPLLEALHIDVEKYDNWTDEENETHWCTVVGLAQTLLPAHIRHHYCDTKVSFWDKPDFKAPTLTRSLKIYNWLVEKSQLWCESLVGLGSIFGIYSDCDARGAAGTRMGGDFDLAALTALDKMRTLDLLTLKERLDTPIQKLDVELTLAGMKL